jgi:hypothetical protein
LNAKRERMVKRVYKWKPISTRPLRRPKNRWKNNVINDMKELKIRIGLAASRIAISGKCMLRRPKHSKNEVVVPKELEENS